MAADVVERLVTATDGTPLALTELPRELSEEQLCDAVPLPDLLPDRSTAGERLRGTAASAGRGRAHAVAADSRREDGRATAAAPRRSRPRHQLGGCGRDGGGRCPPNLHTQSRVPSSSPSVGGLLRSTAGTAASGAHGARRRPRGRRRCRPAGMAPRCRRDQPGRGRRAAARSSLRACEATRRRLRRSRVPVAGRGAHARQRARERVLEAARTELSGGRGHRAREMLERATATGLTVRDRADAAWTAAPSASSRARSAKRPRCRSSDGGQRPRRRRARGGDVPRCEHRRGRRRTPP